MSLMNKEYDFLFKLVIVGNSGVGKSSLLNRFADDNFSDAYLATIGVDFKFKTIPVENKKVKLQIWDTAGQERFRTITNAYYKGADAIVMVYDVTSQTSFDDISAFWYNEAELYGEKDSKIMLLGNKSDLIEHRQVSLEKAKGIAARKEILFYETSAKTSECVETAFNSIAKQLLERKQNQIAQRKREHRESRKKSESSLSARSKTDRIPTEESIESNEKPVALGLPEKKQNKAKEELKKINCIC